MWWKTQHKGQRKIVRIEYEMLWKLLERNVSVKAIYVLHMKCWGDLLKLPALEACYHKNCKANYFKNYYVKENIFPRRFEIL